jgi:hypothetical protein
VEITQQGDALLVWITAGFDRLLTYQDLLLPGTAARVTRATKERRIRGLPSGGTDGDARI